MTLMKLDAKSNVSLDEIVSIEEVGADETYDIEMVDEPRNFIADGFVVHNSHAVAYTMLSFWSMYVKVHYNVEFFCAQLNNSSDDRVSTLSREAEKHGIIITRPDINNSSDVFTINSAGNIVPPIGIIKGVGAKAVEDIIKTREAGVFISKADFESRITKRVCNCKVVGLLQRAGSFESLGVINENEEERVKDYSELLPTYNNMPRLMKGGGDIDPAEVQKVLTSAMLCSRDAGRPCLLPKATLKNKPTIMVINNPVKNESDHLSSDGTKFMMKELKQYGIKPADIYYTSPIKCFMAGGAKPSKECEGKCYDMLRQEIAAVSPKLIVCCSVNILPMFVKDKPSIGKLHGKLIYSKQFKCYVLFSRSPQAAFFNEELMEDFKGAMQTLGSIFI